jgi:hypothetical protein
MSCSACPRSHRARLDPARRALGALGGLLLTLGLLATPAQAQIVLRQIYGGGGHAYDRDFVELFNRGGATESVDGWSIQYASATGSGLFSGAAPSLLAGSLAPGQSLLVGLAASRSGAPLPTPFLAGNPATNLASTSGKVALVRSPEGLACNGGSVALRSRRSRTCSSILVGYGAASFFEGPAAAPAARRRQRSIGSTAAAAIAGRTLRTSPSARRCRGARPPPRRPVRRASPSSWR